MRSEIADVVLEVDLGVQTHRHWYNGRPITYDRFVSTDHGPVLSQTYNLIVAEESPEEHSYWRQFISEPANYEVSLLHDAPNGELSRAQEDVLESVFAEFGHMSRWELVTFCHTLPEWVDPRGSSVGRSGRSRDGASAHGADGAAPAR